MKAPASKKSKILFFIHLLLIFIINETHPAYYRPFETVNDSSWQMIHPFPTDQTISGIASKENEILMFTIPYSGTDRVSELLKTTDNGETWDKKKLSPGIVPINIKRFGSSVFLLIEDTSIVPNKNIILKSNDLGETWINCLETKKFKYKHISGADSLNITAVFTNSYDSVYVYQSSNAGDSWTYFSNAFPYRDLLNVTFPDPQHGWIKTYNPEKIIKTTNGGISWQIVSSSFRLHNFIFTDSLSGINISPQDSLFLTTDGGNTWLPKRSFEHFNQVQFLQRSESGYVYFLQGYLGEFSSRIYFSSDGGNQWDSIGVTWPETFSCLDMTDKWSICGGFYAGGLIKTTDQGGTWKNLTKTFLDEEVYAISFPSSEKGWAATRKGYLYQSLNGGFDWTLKLRDSVFKFEDLLFLSELNGYTVSNYFYYFKGKIGRTTDAGTTWSYNIFNSSQLFRIRFTDSLTGYAVGELDYIHGINYPYVLKTSDGGVTWNKQTNFDFSITTHSLVTTCISFPDHENGWIGGTHSTIFRTTNGGDEWKVRHGNLNPITFWYNFRMHDIYFLNKDTGFAAGYLVPGGFYSLKTTNGYLVPGGFYSLKTTNGGETWDTLQIPAPLDLMGRVRIYFRNHRDGFLFTRYENYRTSDGGESWEVIPGVDGMNGFSVFDNSIWAAGSSNQVYRYDGLPASINGHTYFNKTDYFLEQNYPNPFNPVTKIKFSIPERTSVELAVFNILGEKIKILIDGELNAGWHETVFDAGNLSSGFYFYQLKSGNNNSVRKMLLLK